MIFKYLNMAEISDKDLFYCLALMKIEGVGVVYARKIFKSFPSLSDLFRPDSKEKFSCKNIPQVIFERIKNFKNFELIDKELAFIRENNIQIVLFSDEEYPFELKHCFDAPFMLFFKGNVNFRNDKILSIVGTRNVTTYGSGFVKELIQDLKTYNPIIVSGYAYGVDINAHLAAVENQLQTIAVLGHGLNQTYPKSHQKYNDVILANGCLMSEFWSSDSFNKENFIKRNRIVAGISKATIVIESAIKGGSLSTAKFANDYNKDVFALPGRNTDLYSAGCNFLIKTNQSSVITSAQDLVYILNWGIENQEIVKPKIFEIPSDLTDDEYKVIEFLNRNGPQIIDVIAIETGLMVYKLSVILLNLELRNLINPMPGKLFGLKK